MFYKFFIISLIIFNLAILNTKSFSAGIEIDYPKINWSFSGLFGTFDKASAQRGFQVYREVCSGCHGMRLLSYRNLGALGYNQDELKALASQFEINDGPNDEGEFLPDLQDQAINSCHHIQTNKQLERLMVVLILQIYL